MEKLDGRSLDLIKTNIEALKQLFPEVVTEGKIDFDKLKLVLGEEIETRNEKYEFTWHGKTQAMKLAQTPSTGTLRPDKASSKNWETTENLYIEGDNLEVLKLLQKSYFGKIKMIYIDPPYNTGKDFVYKDDFRDNIKNYKEITQQTTKANTETNGRYHTDWLNMMYPRLKLARNLLRDDGIICVSISDIEEANLRKIMDEIFGEGNFINTVSIKSKVSAGASGGGEDKRLKKNIEYIHIYAKKIDTIEPLANLYQKIELMKLINEMREEGQSWKYTSVLIDYGERKKITTIEDGDGNPIDIYLRDNVKRKTVSQLMREEGLSEEEVYQKYLDRIFSDTNAQSSIRTRVIDAVGSLEEGTMYEVEYTPRSGKMKGEKVVHHYISNSVRRVIWLKDVAEEVDGVLYKKERLSTLWDDIDFNNVGKEGDMPFPNGKKPIELIKRCISIGDDSEGIILDFFAGSGSTAHAVMQLNAEDGGNRKFIMVQLPEKTDETLDAYKAGYKNICEIGKERIRRAGEKIVQETGKTDLDIGFKVFKLDSSNIKEWDPDFDNLEQTLFDLQNNIKEDRTKEDLLYEILLKIGLPLTVPIEEIDCRGKTIYNVAYGSVLVCLEDEIDLDLVQEMLKHRSEHMPPKVIFKESGFISDAVKTNALQTLKKHGITDVRSV